MNEENKYKTRFKELNKVYPTTCCGGKCPMRYVEPINSTLICGKCEQKKHLDYFSEAETFGLCDKCDGREDK